MNRQYAPAVRIVLRWIAALTGATGLAADADLVALGCLIIGFVIEIVTWYAKRTGRPT